MARMMSIPRGAKGGAHGPRPKAKKGTLKRLLKMLLAFASFALGAVLTACNYKVSNVLTVVLCVAVFGYALLAVAIILSAKKPPQTKNAQEGYKTYAQRKEEAAQLPKNETTEEQPLPKLQSFEDVNKKGEWKD